ncbi:MAG: hypothetical protein M3020_28040, partial [Myxococcota bacterium]|nr:hypothetical protein [Myxococcota bacterium]
VTPPDALLPAAELELPPLLVTPPVGRLPPVVDALAPPALAPAALVPPFVLAVPAEPPLPESGPLPEQAGNATKPAKIEPHRPRVVTQRR